MRPRIQALDGLRFFAAIGVLWIHTWTAHSNPRAYIGKFDFADVLAIGVNGVDLFFVISGFCMYYFYASKSDFSYTDFYRFLVKRWIRLSPAFYAATIIYVLIAMFNHAPISPVLDMLHNLFYLNDIGRMYIIAQHFWTLTVEWQFYFIIPFLLIYQNKIGFKNIFLIVFGGLSIVGLICVFVLKQQSDIVTGHLPFRGIEFGCGTLAAWLLLNNKIILKNRVLWFIMFIVITYTGRVCISKPALDLSVNYYNLFKLLGYILMGSGFAGVLYLALTSVGRLNRFLSNRVFKTMGRISYSFYLLHVLIYPVIVDFTINRLSFLTGIWAPVVSTIISAIILYPIAQLSYNLLEKPFLAVGNLTTK